MSSTGKLYAIFFTAIAFGVTLSSVGQGKTSSFLNDQFRAVAWTKEDGLSSDDLNSMIKDVKGFLWIGSRNGGLCRFDGATFKKYRPDKNNRNTINSDKVNSFIEDSLNNIWIGTDKGISRYDSRADTFTNYSPLANSAYSAIPFGALCATRTDVFFMESNGLITAFNIHTRIRRRLVQLSPENDPHPDWSTLHSFFDAGSKSIWLLPANNQRTIQQIFLDGTTKYHRWPCYRNNVEHRHHAEDIRYDAKRNVIWVNSGEGLLKFSLKDEQFYKIEALNEITNTKDYDRGVGIDVDKNGNIWLSSNSNGILIYDPETDHVRPLFKEAQVQKKAGNAALYIYCDQDGITWTSYWMKYGIYEIVPFNPPVKRFAANPYQKDSLSNQQIHSIIPAPKGEIWIGTEDGLNILDTKTNKFRVLRQKDLPGTTGSVIYPVSIDSARQKAWICSAPASNPYDIDLFELDFKKWTCTPLYFKNETKLLDTLSIAAYYFQMYKNGLLIADERHGIFEVNENSSSVNLIIPFKSYTPIARMVVVEDRFIFLQCGGQLPNLSFENKNREWLKMAHMLDTLDWQSMIYDKKNQTYWVGLAYELVHYDKNFKKLKSYRQENGYNGIPYNMLTDDGGNLWFTNDLNQINRLNTDLGVITNISETDGYQKQLRIWLTPMANDERGNLYIGGTNFDSPSPDGGLDQIYPQRYASDSTSNIYVASLYINQKPFPLSTGVNSVEELSLQYNQNTISIETGIIDYYAKGKGHIRYKLQRDGKDEAWQYGPAYYTIRYEGLPPGHYRLVMQASNAGNEFNSRQKIITIMIVPPFWQTPWFRILAAVLVIAIIYGIIQYRSSNLKKRNILLEKMVTERTSELRATQDQLIHSEKMASLGELTSGIAHEIKNPLNFINNFSEINLELITEIDNQPDKEDENAQIIKTLKKNLEKINFHGKRVDDIVKSMLQHSRMGNLTKEPVNVNMLCEESLKLAYHGFKAREKTFQASFETNFEPELPMVMAIPQELNRVLLNLINNAFYAVHAKKKKMLPLSTVGSEIESLYKPMVTVSTKKGDKNIVITVSDNGTGIPQKIISKVFQPFFTTKPTGEGTGLGLSMSYDIISKSHGGEIKVETKEGEGSEFIIQLPTR